MKNEKELPLSICKYELCGKEFTQKRIDKVFCCRNCKNKRTKRVKYIEKTKKG